MSDDTVQPQITAFWDTVATRYDTPDNVASPGSPDYAIWVESVRTVLPSHPADILDVGTGTGFLAGIAAQLGHRVTAVDLSVGMLEASALREGGLAITFAVGDAVNPPFPPGSFDAVISRSLIWTLREPATAFANWYQLLKPGGRVLAFYGLSPAALPVTGSPDREPDLFERYYNHKTQAELPAMRLTDHRPLIDAATAAGFADITTTALEALRGWEASPGCYLPYALVGYRRLCHS